MLGPLPAAPRASATCRWRSRATRRRRHRAGRHVRSRAGMRRIPARFRPRTIRMTPPIDAQRRQVVDQRTGQERGGDAEQREHGAEPGDVRDGVADRGPARWRRARRRAATAIAVSCPRYAGTRGRTHGERKLMTPAARATRIVRSVPLIGSARRGRRRADGAAWPRWSRARGAGRRARRPGSRRSRRARAPDRTRCRARRGSGARGRDDARSPGARSAGARLVAEAAAGAE